MRPRTTIATVLVSLLALSRATAGTQEHFPTPDAAAQALDTAVRDTKSTERLAAVLGPDSDEIISSGDPVEDAAARERYATAASEHTRIERLDDATAVVHVGHDDWPLPIPLVHDADGWRFDSAAGKQELQNCPIGRNELTAGREARVSRAAQMDKRQRCARSERFER